MEVEVLEEVSALAAGDDADVVAEKLLLQELLGQVLCVMCGVCVLCVVFCSRGQKALY